MSTIARNPNNPFKLQVPLDASGIKTLKPGQELKVVAIDGKGGLHSELVKLDAKGAGAANFAFAEQPGHMQVFVGPVNATDEELHGMQTLSVDLPVTRWQKAKELKLPAVVIAQHFWDFWLIWCREFVINGRVLCADGKPVPGATVCAYDVDFWWWWISKQQVGCATTDVHGNFIIKFRWCCGFLPWFWWLRRRWELDETISGHILPALKSNPKLKQLPRLSAKPSLSVFEGLSETASALTRKSTTIQPASLASLQTELAANLPPVREVESLRLWPWFPWAPWFDCSPDIIFQVTQPCDGKNNVIVNETVLNTRWDIPTTLNVTLQANREACCIQPPPPPPHGNCVALARVCGDDVDHIGGNLGAPAVPPQEFGFLNPGLAATDGDRPYAGGVTINGAFGDAAAVDYYEFQWSDDGVNYHDMPAGAIGGVSQQFFGPTIFGDAGLFHPVSLNHTIAGRNVIETYTHFQATHDPLSWNAPATRVWVSDLSYLYTWVTSFAVLPDGLYHLRLLAWTEAALNTGDVTKAQILNVCDVKPDQPNGLAVYIDNRPSTYVAQPCGPVHLCTGEPDTQFISVKLLHADSTTTDLVACNSPQNSHLQLNDVLEVDFAAYDPDGNLAYFTLEVLYGDDSGFYLIDSSGTVLPGGTLDVGAPSALFPAALQKGPNYGQARSPAQGAVSPIWTGGTFKLTIPAHTAFPESCCYMLQLLAYKRTIVDCYEGYAFYNISERSFLIQI